jgi:hypothetical protein
MSPVESRQLDKRARYDRERHSCFIMDMHELLPAVAPLWSDETGTHQSIMSTLTRIVSTATVFGYGRIIFGMTISTSKRVCRKQLDGLRYGSWLLTGKATDALNVTGIYTNYRRTPCMPPTAVKPCIRSFAAVHIRN